MVTFNHLRGRGFDIDFLSGDGKHEGMFGMVRVDLVVLRG